MWSALQDVELHTKSVMHNASLYIAGQDIAC